MRLSGMAGPPADDDAAQVILVEDVPEGFGFAREVRDGPDAAAVRSGFGEAVDAVFERALSGGDGGPEHGRKRRMEGGDLPIAPRSTRLWRWGILPASIRGLMAFQSAASQPIRRTFFFSGFVELIVRGLCADGRQSASGQRYNPEAIRFAEGNKAVRGRAWLSIRSAEGRFGRR